MEDTLYRGNREPSLEQILVEPIVRTIMRRDGVDEQSVRQLMRRMAAAKRPQPPKLDFIPPAPPAERALGGAPQATIGMLAQAAAEARWPRVFPGL